MFPAISLPNTDQELDQRLLTVAGERVNAAEFFATLGGAKNLRLMAQTSVLNAEFPPRITWQYYPSSNEPVVSVAYPAGLDRTGRITYGAVLGKLSDFKSSEELRRRLPTSAAASVPEFALQYAAEHFTDLHQLIERSRSSGELGGDYAEKKTAKFPDATSQYRALALIAVVLMLLGGLLLLTKLFRNGP